MGTTAAPPKNRTNLRPTIVGLVLVIVAAIVGILVHQSGSPSGRPDLAPHTSEVDAGRPMETPSFHEGAPGGPGGTRTGAEGATTASDGALPDGATVFDGQYAGIANLDPALLRAVRTASNDAADDGIQIYVNSGWRSPGYQNELLRGAVIEYGSESEAARWVATAETSPHVSGDAVDIGPSDATEWLSANGAEYGLCQIYRNEHWHYELRPEAISSGCPSPYDNPTHDPRMNP